MTDSLLSGDPTTSSEDKDQVASDRSLICTTRLADSLGHTHTRTRAHTYKHGCIRTHTHTLADTHARMHVHVYIDKRARADPRTHAHMLF